MEQQENFKNYNYESKEKEIKTVEKVKAMRDFLYLRDKRVEANEKIFKIVHELEKNYSRLDLEKTYLFNIMLSSTIDREECTKFDLPGEDSIVKHLETLVKEYQAKAE